MSEDPPITHGISPKKTNPNRVHLYIPPVDLPWVQEAQRALLRDGSSLSAWTLDQLRAWWDMHKPGNPQLGMERFVQGPSQQEAAAPSCVHDWLLTRRGFTAPVWLCQNCGKKRLYR